MNEKRFVEINHALKSGKPENLNKLKLNSSEINNHFIDQHGMKYSLLQYALVLKQVAIVEALIEMGANLNVRDFLDHPVLHEVILTATLEKNEKKKRKWHDILRQFLQKGADFEAKDKIGDTALTLAVSHQDWEVVEILESFGAEGRFR